MFECCSDTLCMSGKPGCPPEQSYHSYVTCLFLLFLKVVLSDLPFSQGVVFFFCWAASRWSYCSMHAHLFFHIHMLLAYARTHTPSHVPQSRSHAHTIQCYCRDRFLFLLSLGIFRRSMPSNTLCMVCSDIKIITSFAREHGLKESNHAYAHMGLCAILGVIVPTILSPSPVILMEKLGGKPKWLPLNLG